MLFMYFDVLNDLVSKSLGHRSCYCVSLIHLLFFAWGHLKNISVIACVVCACGNH